MEQRIIACLGSGNSQPSDDRWYPGMQEVGRLLAERNCVVATGGFGGIGMEAPSRGARQAGGHVIGYTMRGMAVNEYVVETVDTDHALSPEAQYAQRLGRLLEAQGFIIAAQGGPGTLVEFFSILNLNSKMWEGRKKKLAILERSDWIYTLLRCAPSLEVLPSALGELILVTTFPEEAVNWVAPVL